MRLIQQQDALLPMLRDVLEQHGIVYGTGPDYCSLLAATSVLISPSEQCAIERDLQSYVNLYRTTSQLYLESLTDKSLGWLRASAEYGLLPPLVRIGRRAAQRGLEPLMMRVDYVDVNEDQCRAAEIQWKSGGPGLIIGHQTAFDSVFPPESGQAELGSLVECYLSTLKHVAHSQGNGIVLNEVRTPWLPGEAHLTRRAAHHNLTYRAVDRTLLQDRLSISRSGLTYSASPLTEERVSVLRGRGFTEILSPEQSTLLAQLVDDDKLWIETPLNFLYRQKWMLALPFMAQFRDLFSDDVRAGIIPTALLSIDHLDLSGVLDSLDPVHASRMESVDHLMDLADLPESTRRKLVLKCGAGTGNMQSRGRGVFRITGSSSQARRVLALIAERLSDTSEPWILQPYVGTRHSVSVAVRDGCDSPQQMNARMRLMVFGGRDLNSRWRLHGAVANFASHWKVSGGPGSRAPDGTMTGSCFAAVRAVR